MSTKSFLRLVSNFGLAEVLNVWSKNEHHVALGIDLNQPNHKNVLIISTKAGWMSFYYHNRQVAESNFYKSIIEMTGNTNYYINDLL